MIKKLLLFVCFCGVMSCHKNSSGDAEPEFYGTASAIVNNKAWMADKVRCGSLPMSCFNGKLEIDMEKYNSAGILSEQLSFVKFVPSVSEQVPYPENFANECNDTLNGNYSTLNDDVLLNFYDTDSSSGNYFRVDSYDPKTRKITGSFGGIYIINTRPINDSISPDTIRVTNGQFSTKVLF